MKRLLLCVTVFLVALLASCDGQGASDVSSLFHRHEWGEREEYDPEANAALTCDARRYYRACRGCSEIRWESGTAADHEFFTYYKAPNCTESGGEVTYCRHCVYRTEAREEALGHAPATSYSHDAYSHWYTCEVCKCSVESELHDLSSNGLCRICGAESVTKGIVYELSADGTYAIVKKYSGNQQNVIIAGRYEGVPVTMIGEQAFVGDFIKSVEIPDTVTEIGDGAFSGCNSLSAATLGTGLVKIGDRAFFGCKNLASVTLGTGLVKIGEGAFSECEKLLEIDFPDGLKEIGNRAFAGCTSLKTLYLPDRLERIGVSAFENCKTLKDLYIPNSVTELGERAFRYCTGLQKVEIGSGVRTVSAQAFNGCRGFTTLSIPYTLTHVEAEAFNGCTLLMIVRVRGGNADDLSELQVESGNGSFLNATYYYNSAVSVDLPARS